MGRDLGTGFGYGRVVVRVGWVYGMGQEGLAGVGLG